MQLGIEEMEAQLKVMGYETKRYEGDFIAFQYVIPLGRFRDRVVEIALQIPGSFPQMAPAGPHICPFLMPTNQNGGAHPDHGIHQRNVPTSEFQYWSRPFPEWEKSEKTAKVYLAFLRTLFDFK